MSNIYVSSPGKVILHGEHAVVYGKRAIAASLNIRTFLHLSPTPNGQSIFLDLPDIKLSVKYEVKDLQISLQLPLCDVLCPVPPSEEVLHKLREFAGLSEDATSTESMALVSFLYLYSSISPSHGKLPAFSLHLTSGLPPSAGLGSSAAYSTCLSAGLLELAGVVTGNSDRPYSDQDLKLINRWAFISEVIIHGKPSGIDNSISTYGGALCFQGGQITPLCSVPKFRILLTNTHVLRSTKVQVTKLREKYNKYPDIIGPVIDSVESISKKYEEIICQMNEESKDQDYKILEELIVMNQHLLSVFGVSHPTIDSICKITSQHGLQSKLTGAGAGGCTFTLIPPGTDDGVVITVVKALEKEGYSCWETEIGGAGVTRHNQLESHLNQHNHVTSISRLV